MPTTMPKFVREFRFEVHRYEKVVFGQRVKQQHFETFTEE